MTTESEQDMIAILRGRKVTANNDTDDKHKTTLISDRIEARLSPYIYIKNDFNRGGRLLCRRMKVTENTELTTFLILLLNLRCPVVNSLSLFLALQTYNNNNNNNGNFICVFECTIVNLATYRQFTDAA